MKNKKKILTLLCGLGLVLSATACDITDKVNGVVSGALDSIGGVVNGAIDKTEEILGLKNEVKVTFKMDDAELTQIYSVGDSYTLPEANPMPGYNFEGWYLGDLLIPMEGKWEFKEDVTLVPHWTTINYTITYVGAGAEAAGNPTRYTVVSEKIVLQNPVREGYDFDGWWIGEEKVTVIVPCDALQNLEVVAKWSAKKYEVTFNTGEGNSTLVPASVTYDAAYDFSSLLPTANGYHFVGWLLNGESFSSEGVWKYARDVELVADWTPNEYNVSFNLNGGVGTAPTSAKVEFNDAWDWSAVENIQPVRVGYQFLGWYNGDTLVGVTGDAWNISEHVVLKAEWELETYQITYAGLPDSVTVSNPTSYTVTDADIVLEKPVGEYGDKIFLGWQIEKGENVTTVNTAKGGNITLTAVWLEETTFSITYVIPEKVGTSSTNNPKTYTTLDDLIYLDKPVWKNTSDYRFIGWYDENGNKITEIDPAQGGDRTITAKFQSNWSGYY